VDNRATTNQFRPITLSYTLYKIISKILVDRLLPIQECIISLVQRAFAPKEATHDNILLAHEIKKIFNFMRCKQAYIALS